ncbi:Dephospho-CoA kinase [Oceanicola granulosus HTCC2516]|uniref:Dephospho-CoA kinase n=1 Tax=Oceanicola granulosus (strain ATCC BAA-861 / DSM 15982 / KCTC 12143 / HTCC2516) TaxID=314256 RepID=Q2CJU7_OCEGH|nr:dephospho-CoA kinase [Oceanicola granulosus]EAR53042.1 Dephospho-CoA kinase [Oceanicola granulosus HTCC2516]
MSKRKGWALGLTGSIGMGKSTTAAMFRDEGLPVWDADTAVHRLYARGGAAVGPIATAFPAAIRDDAVSREALKELIAQDATVLAEIEALVHPLVLADRNRFLAETETQISVCDIPLLYETGADATMDSVAVVTVPLEVQKQRVLARPDMTEAHFQAILARQMPDAEKRRRADHIIETLTLEGAKAQVVALIAELRERIARA